MFKWKNHTADIQEMEMDLRHVLPDEELWKQYMKELRKEYRKVSSPETGIVQISYYEKQMDSFGAKVLLTNVLSRFMDTCCPLCPIEIDRKQQKILPLDLSPESVTYLLYSTRLAILQTDKTVKEWLLQYFINIKLFYNESYFNYYFFDEELEQVLGLEEISYSDVSEEESILVYTKKKLDKGIYVNVHLDEFYLSEKDNFERRHYVHENLIYGYDDNKKILYAYGFTRNQKIDAFSLSYEEFLLAFEKGKLFFFCGAGYLEKEYPWPVMLCWIKKQPEYQFTIQKFAEKIREYIAPDESEMVQGDYHVYGMNVCQKVVEGLKSEEGIPVDFRTFQLLYEQKECILRRARYLAERYHQEKEWEQFFNDYKEIRDGYQRIRLVYLKQLMEEGKTGQINQTITDDKLSLIIAGRLEVLLKKERNVLEGLLQIINRII